MKITRQPKEFSRYDLKRYLRSSKASGWEVGDGEGNDCSGRRNLFRSKPWKKDHSADEKRSQPGIG